MGDKNYKETGLPAWTPRTVAPYCDCRLFVYFGRIGEINCFSRGELKNRGFWRTERGLRSAVAVRLLFRKGLFTE